MTDTDVQLLRETADRVRRRERMAAQLEERASQRQLQVGYKDLVYWRLHGDAMALRERASMEDDA